MTDFETIRVELPSGRALEAQRETRHSVWMEGWELAEVGDVVRIQGAPWRVEGVQRARIGGQRATRLRVVRQIPEAAAPWRSPSTPSRLSATSGTLESEDEPRRAEGRRPSSRRRSRGRRHEQGGSTGGDLDRRLSDALGWGSAGERPRYASELGALMRLTSHMERLGYRLSYTRVTDAPIVARVEPVDGSRSPFEATGPTVAEALCRASLAALERWESAGSEAEVEPPPRRPSRRPVREDGEGERSHRDETVEQG